MTFVLYLLIAFIELHVEFAAAVYRTMTHVNISELGKRVITEGTSHIGKTIEEACNIDRAFLERSSRARPGNNPMKQAVCAYAKARLALDSLPVNVANAPVPALGDVAAGPAIADNIHPLAGADEGEAARNVQEPPPCNVLGLRFKANDRPPTNIFSLFANKDQWSFGYLAFWLKAFLYEFLEELIDNELLQKCCRFVRFFIKAFILSIIVLITHRFIALLVILMLRFIVQAGVLLFVSSLNRMSLEATSGINSLGNVLFVLEDWLLQKLDAMFSHEQVSNAFALLLTPKAPETPLPGTWSPPRSVPESEIPLQCPAPPETSAHPGSPAPPARTSVLNSGLAIFNGVFLLVSFCRRGGPAA